MHKEAGVQVHKAALLRHKRWKNATSSRGEELEMVTRGEVK